MGCFIEDGRQHAYNLVREKGRRDELIQYNCGIVRHLFMIDG